MSVTSVQSNKSAFELPVKRDLLEAILSRPNGPDCLALNTFMIASIRKKTYSNEMLLATFQWADKTLNGLF